MEQFDLGIKKAAEYQADDLKTHFIVAGEYYWYSRHRDTMKSMILKKMKKYGIKEAMVTIIRMRRWKLITKEKMEDYYKGKEEDRDGDYKESVHDDLDSFFDKLQNGWWEEEEVVTYFIPKLTEKEKKLVEEKDKDHLMSYYWHAEDGLDPDVSKKEMDESESKSKFVKGDCNRQTFILKSTRRRPNGDNQQQRQSTTVDENIR